MADTLGGWNYYVLSWDWTALVLAGLPGWEQDGNGEAPSIFLEFTRRDMNTEVRSREIATEWDDLAKHNFYYRDWTRDTLPFVREGEKYWSTFSFQRRSEAERFQKKYGGFANWVPGWQEHLDSIFRAKL
jgi:hypothetical protein